MVLRHPRASRVIVPKDYSLPQNQRRLVLMGDVMVLATWIAGGQNIEMADTAGDTVRSCSPQVAAEMLETLAVQRAPSE